jgi:hypothetical protein
LEKGGMMKGCFSELAAKERKAHKENKKGNRACVKKRGVKAAGPGRSLWGCLVLDGGVLIFEIPAFQCKKKARPVGRAFLLFRYGPLYFRFTKTTNHKEKVLDGSHLRHATYFPCLD